MHVETKMIDAKCGTCCGRVYDYASNRRNAKNGVYYCSRKCAGEGRAYLVSIALGGDKLNDPSLFAHGKSNRDKVYYRRNADSVRERANDYYAQNKGDVIARRQKQDRELKQEIIDAFGGACECCNEDTFEFLTIDHINGDGAAHRREIGGKGRRLYKAIKAEGFPKSRYRLLCLNCNITLGFYGYCPHHPEIKAKNISHVPFNPGRKRKVA